MIFKSDQSAGELNGFLDSGSRMEGELRFDTTFRVDGKFTGKVISDGSLVVGEDGEIDGDVHVGELFVSGTVRGQIQIGERVQIASGGKVFADLDTPSLVIEDGAFFEGHCSMTRSGGGRESTAVAELKAVQPKAKHRGQGA